MAKYKRKRANGGDISYNGNPVNDSSKDLPVKNNSVSAGQVLGYGQAGLNAYNQVNAAYNNPNSTDSQKGDAAYNAGVGVVGSINPVIGGLIGIGDSIGKPIKQSVEKYDANGNLKNENAAQAGYIAGTLFNPAKSLSNTLTDKSASTGQKVAAGLTGGLSNILFSKQYTNKLEKDAKSAIEEQQQIDQQNLAAQQAQQQAQQDYINKQIQAGISANQMSWGGKMKSKKMCADGGELTSYDGGFKHEDSDIQNIHEGIPVGNGSVVEKGETRGPKNSEMEDYIYSDRLKVPGKKYTFAKASKMIESKFSKRDNDKMSSEQKERELLNLMNSQEEIRQKMMSSAYKRAYGGEMVDSQTFGNDRTSTERRLSTNYPVYQNINGTPVKGYINTDPTSFSKLNRTGANQIALNNAQVVPQAEINANMGTGNYFGNYTGNSNLNTVGLNDFRMTTDGAGNKYYWKGTTPISEAEYKPKFATGGDLYKKEVDDINNQYQGTKYDPLAKRSNNFDINSLHGIGNFIGSAYDIYRGLKPVDPINYERITPDLVNYNQSRDLIQKNLQTGYNSTVGNIRSVVNNPAQYLNLVTQVAANRDGQLSDAIRSSQEAESNANAQIRNQAKAANAQTQRLELDARELAKDQKLNTLQTGLTNFGYALANTGRDKQLKISQEEAKQFIGSADYAPVFNKKGKISGYKHRLTGETYNIKD